MKNTIIAIALLFAVASSAAVAPAAKKAEPPKPVVKVDYSKYAVTPDKTPKTLISIAGQEIIATLPDGTWIWRRTPEEAVSALAKYAGEVQQAGDAKAKELQDRINVAEEQLKDRQSRIEKLQAELDKKFVDDGAKSAAKP